MERLGEQKDSEEKEPEKGNKTKYSKLKTFLCRKDNLILIILGGILLMIIAMPTGTKQDNAEDTTGLDNMDNYLTVGQNEESVLNSEYQSGIEKRLEELLLQWESCDNVRVMITFEEGDTDISGKYDYCFTYPEISGIVVCINNGDDPIIVEKVTAYIQALFSVEVHKIKVANIKTSAYGG